MGLPKSKNDINPYPPLQGEARVEELMKEWNGKTNFGVEGMTLEDIDTAFTEYFGERCPAIDGKKVPIFFLSNERWADFRKTWAIRDKDKNILLPYVTVGRSDTVKGTRMGDTYKVPQNRKFEYRRVPNVDGDKRLIGYDIYRMPIPTPIDCTYELSLLTRYMEDANGMDEFIYPLFSSLQAFLNIRGNWMQMILNSQSPEQEQPLDAEKIYKRTYSILVRGFVQNPNDIEVIHSVKRAVYSTEFKI